VLVIEMPRRWSSARGTVVLGMVPQPGRGLQLSGSDFAGGNRPVGEPRRWSISAGFLDPAAKMCAQVPRSGHDAPRCGMMPREW